jgi:hypothetical protein
MKQIPSCKDRVALDLSKNSKPSRSTWNRGSGQEKGEEEQEQVNKQLTFVPQVATTPAHPHIL